MPDPDEMELLAEAALVAAMNGRAKVLDVLIDLGYPVDHRFWLDVPLTHFAIQHDMDTVIEVLVRRGCDLDLKVAGQQPTARDFIAMMLSNSAPGPTARTRRIAAMCGVAMPSSSDVDGSGTSRIEEQLDMVLRLAGADAAASGESTIREEQLVIGLLRASQDFGLSLLANGRVDLLGLRDRLGDRVAVITEYPPATHGAAK
ncbi:MAG: hypothetical protein HC937_02890 [Aquincola sp.]|nr:hypothetical protein [Aquincola sp.]